MLFISRRIADKSYGLVSTSDNSEIEITQKQLVELVCDKGKSVAGVEVSCWYDADGVKAIVSGISVYQPPETLSVMQVKTSLLLHVDITVWNSRISGIVVHGDKIELPVVIRLSAFGTCCGDRLLISSEAWGCHKVTFIVDDDIQISELAFCTNYGADVGVDNIGIKFDLREANHEETVRNVYMALVDGVCDGARFYGDPFKSVIDRPERVEEYKRLFARELGFVCCT